MTHKNALLLSAEHSQLVLIDVQIRLAAAMSETDRARVMRHGAILARGAGLLGVPVLATEQYPRGLGTTEPALLEALPENTPLIDKTCFACSGNETFRLALAASQRRQLVLAGMESHVCVLQTALDLHSEGYQVFVVEDAVSSRDLRHQQNAMARLRQAGVVVTNTESVLFEWLRDASHEKFKAVSALIK